MLISFRANTTPSLPLNNFRKTHCRRHRPAEDHFLPHRRLRNSCQTFPRILGKFDLLLFSLRHTSISIPRLHPLLLRPFAEGYGSGFQLHGPPKQCCWNLLLFFFSFSYFLEVSDRCLQHLTWIRKCTLKSHTIWRQHLLQLGRFS